jgi:hypothetical protein
MRPKRALLAYCALAQRLNTKNISIMQALTPFLGEACEQFSGELFDAAKFSNAIEANYGLKIPRLAVLGLTDQLFQAKILEISSKTTSGSVVYKYTRKISNDIIQPVNPLTESEIDGVLKSFADFCLVDPLLKDMGRETLDAAFLERLLNIDSMKLLSRREASITTKKTAETIQATKKLVKESSDKQALHLDFLASQYLLDLRDKNPAAFETVSNVAFASMAAEAIACLKDTDQEKNSLGELTVYLDAPLLLDMLNVNSEYAEYGRELLSCISESGAVPAILDHCISEAEAAVHAQLNYLRSGVNKFAFKLGTSATPDLLTALHGNIGERAETRLGIKLVRDPEVSLHRKYPQVVGDIEANMNTSMRAWGTEEAKDYDRKSVWSLLQLRDTSNPSSRICDCKSLLLTRNVALVSIANRQWSTFLKGATKHSANTIERAAPIAMSDKQFAGYVWLRAGGKFSDVSRARLLAHCSAAIRPRADIKARAYNLALELSGQENADDIAALLEDKEGGKALMRTTVGDPEDVTMERLPYIIEQVKLAAGEFAAQKAREESEKTLQARNAQHIEELERIRNEATEKEEKIEGELRAATSNLIQEQLAAESLSNENARLRGEIGSAEKKQYERKKQILSEGFDAGIKAFVRMRWFIAILIGLLSGLATIFSTENPYFSAFITFALGTFTFIFPPLKIPTDIAMRHLRLTVSQKDQSIEIPDSPPNFREKSWGALD